MTTSPTAPEVTAIIGGGAAGLCAAIHAPKSLLLEAGPQFGRKILASGGGRCNILPVVSSERDFSTSGSLQIVKRILRTWPVAKQRAFFEDDLRIPLMEEPDTQKLFPRSQNARDVRDALLTHATTAGTVIQKNWKVAELSMSGNRFDITNEKGEVMHAQKIILAAGGQSVPATGSDGSGFTLAKQLGHSILPACPALVPLLTRNDRLKELAGITLPVSWKACLENGKKLAASQELSAFLFTHHGFSGPAVLDASHWHIQSRATITVSWLGLSQAFWEEKLSTRSSGSGTATLRSIIARHLPKRLAETLPTWVGLSTSQQLAQLDRESRKKLMQALTEFPLPISGNRGFEAAEATCGGVPLDEINPKTLESRIVPGLYFCGEVLDVHGRIGGFNFQWAWATGRLAGLSASLK